MGRIKEKPEWEKGIQKHWKEVFEGDTMEKRREGIQNVLRIYKEELRKIINEFNP